MQRVRILLSIFLWCCYFGLDAQSAKKFYKEGTKNFREGNYASAKENFTKALELKPDNYKYYISRAQAFEKLKGIEDAIKDYESALAIKSSDKKILIKTADLCMSVRKWEQSLRWLNLFLAKDRKNIPVLQKATWSHLMIRQYDKAMERINQAIDKQNYNHVNHYYKALVFDSLKDYNNANLEYNKAIGLMKQLDENKTSVRPKYKPYFVNQATVYQKLKTYDEAIKNYATALDIDKADTVLPQNFYVLYLKSFPHLEKSDFNSAIGELNRSVVLNPKYRPTFYQRGLVYKLTSQFQSAISDFTKVIQFNDKDFEAYVLRGECNMELAEWSKSIADFGKALEIRKDKKVENLLEEVKKKDYEANRESDPPSITILYPHTDQNNFANVLNYQRDIIVEGFIKDKSLIQQISINGSPAAYDVSDKNPNFVCRVPLKEETRRLDILVKDIYGNEAVKSMKLGKLMDESRLKVKFVGRLVTKDSTHTPFANKKVFVTNGKGEVLFETFTDPKGNFVFVNLPFDKNFLMTVDGSDPAFANADGFLIIDENSRTVMETTIKEGTSFKFEMVPFDYKLMTLMSVDDVPLKVDVKGRLVGDNDTKTPIANVRFSILDPLGKTLATSTTDAEGFFAYYAVNPALISEYAVDNEDAGKIQFKSILVVNDKGIVVRRIERNAEGKFKFRLLDFEKSQLSAIAAEEIDPWLSLDLNPNKNEKEIIENIYYESGQYKILPEAEAILQKVIDALMKRQNLVLEVQSHTDAMASDEYNMDLSQKRAQAVVDYLILKGIDKKRLKAVGFGETQLTNGCKNGVDCSDEEHRQNRRTVFKLTYQDPTQKGK